MPTILIADDNRQIISILSEYAKKEGYTVTVAADGDEALAKFEQYTPDVVLLDVMMPKKDGFAVCKILRKTSTVPILIITARGEDFERILGLDIGADDYIVKPFSPGEVMARVRAILRRSDRMPANADQIFSIDNLRINLEQYTVTVGSQPILLTKKGVELLWTLASGKGRVFSRDNLLNALWGYDYCGDSRTVDSHIKRLRAKLDEQPHPAWDIKTIWGVGYKFEVNSNVEK